MAQMSSDRTLLQLNYQEKNGRPRNSSVFLDIFFSGVVPKTDSNYGLAVCVIARAFGFLSTLALQQKYWKLLKNACEIDRFSRNGA